MKFNEIVVISGKGGTGKTTVTASLIPYFDNLVIGDCDVDADGKAVAGNRCTMCYRCISKCPQKAITLLGKKVVDQHIITKYV